MDNGRRINELRQMTDNPDLAQLGKELLQRAQRVLEFLVPLGLGHEIDHVIPQQFWYRHSCFVDTRLRKSLGEEPLHVAAEGSLVEKQILFARSLLDNLVVLRRIEDEALRQVFVVPLS